MEHESTTQRYLRSTPAARRGLALAAGVALAAAALAPAAANAAPSATGCDNRTNNTYAKLLECVRVGGVVEHLDAFQSIADANGGTRAAGTPGYEASVDYVVERLEAAGWRVTIDEFDYVYTARPTIEQTAPAVADHEGAAFEFAASGAVTGGVVPVDIALELPRANTSACEASDFAGLDFSGPADIALIQRGSCDFGVKARNAQAAGAEAVVIFNQGDADTPARMDVIGNGTLGSPVPIPVVGASFDAGVALAAAGSTATVTIADPVDSPQKNVIAELPGANADNVVMAGAHLDSVNRGSGINDNASGSAALLEVAEQIAKVKPQNTLRFAWWGAEEDGLLGSRAYVADQSTAELDRIALYLNFDMVASPNHIFMVYDGDESGFAAPVTVPAGSIEIEDLFESYFTWAGVPYDDAEFSGRSDYQAFIQNGIPAGGLFTGAEVVKTPEQAAIWGGTAGEQYDPCYHLPCDGPANINTEALDVNSDAIAFAVLTYAYSTESVNGVRGKSVPGGFRMPVPAGPEGTVGSDGGHEGVEAG